MSATQYMPLMPPAGTYPYQQQAYYPPQNYSPQQNYYPPPQYQQSPPQQALYPQPQYPQQYQGLQQFQQPPPYPLDGPTPPPLQSWPSHAQEYMGPGVKYSTYRDEDTPDYNNPPQPQYGIPESERQSQHQQPSESRDGSDPRFVFPNNNGLEQQGPDGERGLGATVLGGGAGAFLGNKMHHGALGTIGGLAIGAIAANAIEHHEKKKKEERRESRAFDEGYEDGEDRSRHHSRSRDLDDGDYGRYEDERYEEEEYEPRRHHHHRPRDYDDDYYQRDDYYQEDYYDRRDDY